MSVSSADPARLNQFTTNAAPARVSAQEERSSTNSLYLGVYAACAYRRIDIGSLGALATALESMGANETFVSTVRSALLAADAHSSGPVTVNDAQILAALQAAGAGTPPAPVQFDPMEMVGEPPTSGFVDDPICAANGNMVHQDTDVELPGIAGALNLTRTWNSLTHDRVGAFGPGWSSILDVRLAVDGDLVGAHLPDGALVVFVRDGDGWLTAARRFLRLRSTSDGHELELDPVRRLDFDRAGTLTGWRVGVARVTVARDEQGRVIGLHETVTGRSLAVAWADGVVESLALDDGRTVVYHRDDDGLARRVSSEAGALDYRYDGTLLTSVVDADGVAAFVNEYDDERRVARQTSPFGRVTTYRYDPTGITVVLGDDGVRQAMVHDGFGQLTAVIDVDGSAMRLRYDDVGHVVEVVERDGATWHYDYDERGDLVRRVDPDGGEHRWTWDDQHRLVQETDRAGSTWRMEFDGDHRAPARVTGPAGEVTRQTLDERGLPLVMVDPDGVEEHYEWDGNGQLVAVVDALGGRRRIDYDVRGHVTRLAPALGEATTLELDHAGRVVRRVRGDEVATYTYTAAGRCRAGTEPGDVGWSASFGPHGAVSLIRDAEGSTVTFDYDSMGNVVAVTAPDAGRYEQRYDAVGRHVASTDPSGATTTKAYDRIGRLIELTEPGGGRWQRELDVLGRTVASTAPDGTTTRWTYHPNGEVATVTGPEGRTWRTEVDADGRPVAVLDPAGGRAEIEYTPGGRVRRRTSPAGRIESFEYDAAGRLAAVVGTDGVRRELGRDARGFVTHVQDPQRTVGYRWDDGYRLIGVTATEDGRRAETTIERDAGGRVVSVTDPTGVSSRYSWDGRGLLASATDPAGHVTRFRSDDRGRLAAQVTGDRAMHLHYGRDGRVAGIVDPSGATTDYHRDANGHLVGLRHGDGSGWDRRLDPLGRELERTGTDGTVFGQYDYDAGGRMVSARGEAGAASFLWDDHDALVAIDTPEGRATVERDGDGWVRATTGPDGVRVEYERDAAGRIRSVRVDGDRVDLPTAPVSARDLAGRLTIDRDGTVHRYDDAGRLAERAPSIGAPTRLTYDDEGLVAREDGPDGTRRFAYDAAGRVTSISIDGVGTTTVTYDAAGRRQREARPDGTVVVYGWDATDRLASVTTTDRDGRSTELTIAYDAFGRPVLADDTTFGYDPVAGQCDRQGERRFVNVGSWRYDLESRSWRLPDPDQPAGGVPLGAGLVALGARVLDLTTHQFLSADPLLAAVASNGAASAYTYAWHDPVNYVDPSGLRPISMEEYDAIRTQQEQGRLGQAWEAIKNDPWGTLAMVGVAAVGVGLLFVPGGQAIGAGILIGVGTSAAVGLATGNFSPRAVAIGGAFGAIPGGSTLRGALALGAVSGAGETVAHSVFTGNGLPSWQQLAVGTLIGTAGGGVSYGATRAISGSGAVTQAADAPSGTTVRATTADATASLDHAVRPTGQVPYGSTDLSQAAIAARQDASMFTGRNTAVFEYATPDGPAIRTGFSQRNVGHAERLVWRDLDAEGVQASDVTRIYSELEPCSAPGGYCGRWIDRTFPQAEVTWSFEYGADQASRQAGVQALRDAVGGLDQ